MRHLGTMLAASLVAGCAIALPLPSSVAPNGQIAVGSPPSLNGAPGIVWQPSSLYTFASPRPDVQIAPANPGSGQQVQVSGSGAPPDRDIEIWLMPRLAGGFKAGLYHPRDAGGIQVGTTHTDAKGGLLYRFTFMTPEFDTRIVPRGYYELWLVYPPGTIVAPTVVSWQHPPATKLTGNVYDASGKRIGTGATVDVVVKADSSEVIYAKTVPVVDGAYAFDDVPEPATTTLTVRVPGWPKRSRTDGLGMIQQRWAGAGPIVGVEPQGNPLVYNFGGPPTTDDPDAPGYFLAPDADAPNMAFASLTGRVFDKNGAAIPDSAGAKVYVDSGGVTPPFHAVVDVVGGAYKVDRVPTGVQVGVDLRTNPMYPLMGSRTKVLVPEKVGGRPNILNYGGPSTTDDPDAPRYPYPSPATGWAGPSPLVPAGAPSP